MVREPETLRQLDLGEALYRELFSSSTKTVTYALYEPGQRGAVGTLVNGTLRSLLAMNLLLNVVLIAPAAIATVAGAIVSLPLVLPYWFYRRIFMRDDDLFRRPTGARIVLLPMVTVIWLVSIPIRPFRLMAVLVAFWVGPRR